MKNLSLASFFIINIFCSSFDIWGNDTNSALHNAVKKGELETVDFLIKHGAEVNAKNDKSATPLHLAIKNNKTDIVKLLIEHKAKVNNRDYKGNTPLLLAVRKNNFALIELLVDKDANVDEANSDDDAPLDIAVEQDNLRIVKFLIKNGADVNKRKAYSCNQGSDRDRPTYYTPLELAIKKENREVIKILLKNGAKPTPDEKRKIKKIKSKLADKNLLYSAIKEQNKEVLACVINTGIDVNMKNEDDITPLECSIKTENIEAAKFLINAGADFHIKNEKDKNLLQFALEKDNIELVKILVTAPIILNTAISFSKMIFPPDKECLARIQESSHDNGVKLFKNLQEIDNFDKENKKLIYNFISLRDESLSDLSDVLDHSIFLKKNHIENSEMIKFMKFHKLEAFLLQSYKNSDVILSKITKEMLLRRHFSLLKNQLEDMNVLNNKNKKVSHFKKELNNKILDNYKHRLEIAKS